LRFIQYIALFVAILCLLSCSQPRGTGEDLRPRVVVTTDLIADIVKSVGGDFVVVETLAQSGLNPHTYVTSERNIAAVANADIIFYNGLGLEKDFQEILVNADSNTPVYAVSEYILQSSLIKLTDSNTIVDPHVWLDPTLWIHAVNRVADSLTELDPVNTIYYRKNQDTYMQQLILLNESIQAQLNAVPAEQRAIITVHNAFAYFGRAYGWTIASVQGVDAVHKPTVPDLQRIVNIAKGRTDTSVFMEISLSTRPIEAMLALAEAQGVPLRQDGYLYSDSLGADDTTANTYVGMMEHNVDAIIVGTLRQ
jgi:manganese/zinc/iron transport system substrate-binding protein